MHFLNIYAIKNTVLSLIYWSVGIYLAIGLLIYLGQNYIIFLPIKTELNPNSWELKPVEKIRLNTQDGETLTAWYGRAQQNKPTIVYFHGNAGHLGYRSNIIKKYLESGVGVFILSYRGYGDSTGSPSEKGIFEDARTALNYIKNKNLISDNCLVLYGESLGTAVAIQIATEYKYAAMILVSPFVNATSVAKHYYGIYPVQWLVGDLFASDSKISKFTSPDSPILVVHSRDDEVIPFELGKALYDKLPGNKKLKVLTNYGHNDMPDLSVEISTFIYSNNICKKLG